MAYYPNDETDRRLAKLERKLNKEYKKAWVELSARANEYFEKYEDRWQKEYDAFLDGKYTKQQFQLWEQAQLARGEHWTRLRDQVADRLTETNEIAAAMINDATPYIFALNHNYEAYMVESYAGGTFELVDENTVKELMLGKNHSEFRVNSINRKRDYDWNTKQIQSALTSGIMQGDSIDRMTNRFMNVMHRNRTAAIRNARTSVTSAQNGGRQQCYTEAAQMGIKLQKEWMATLDERTRESHQNLDGERVDHDKPFSNGLMYPGDPLGSPKEVYNCRCTMIAVMDETKNKARKTYSQWIEHKEAVQARDVNVSDSDNYTTKRYNKNVVCDAAVGTKNKIYVSRDSEISQEGVELIDRRVDEAAALLGLKDRPQKIIVASVYDIQKSVAALYSYSDDTIYFNDIAANEKDLIYIQNQGGFAAADNPLSTYVHELRHYQQASEYRSSHGNTSGGNYIKWAASFYKNVVEQALRSGYSISDIGFYAMQNYELERYDEVDAELAVVQVLGK